MKTVLVILIAILLNGCAHSSDTRKALEAGEKHQVGSWTRPDTSTEQMRDDYTFWTGGIPYTRETYYSQKDLEDDLAVCTQANVDRDRHLRNQLYIPLYGSFAQHATLSVERCMKSKGGWSKIEGRKISTAEEVDCMKSRGYEWEIKEESK
jgi:hypothetical protein